MPTLHLQVCAGFANRLRALIAGICFAEDHGLQLVIHWFPKSPECACRFSSVLDPESLPKTVKIAPEDTWQATEVLSEDQWRQAYAKWDQTSDLTWKSYGIFYSNANYNVYLRQIKPSLFVKEFLTRRFSSIEYNDAIGVHIRRTDNKKSIEGSPFESFLKKMETLSTGFFVVATDEKTIKETLEKQFANRCFFPAGVLTRKTEEGMIHGVADFFALSKCSKIIGSVASSFSEMAARYGDIELELMTS